MGGIVVGPSILELLEVPLIGLLGQLRLIWVEDRI